MSHIYKTIEVGSFKVEIVHDDDAWHCNPRTDSDWNGSVLAIYERNALTGDDDETSGQQVSARAKQLDELCETYRKRLCAEIPKYDEAYRRLLESLDAQVEHYSDWAQGNVYGYVVRDETGDTLMSCRGFIGEPNESGVIYDGVDAAKALIEYEKKQTRLCEQAMHL